MRMEELKWLWMVSAPVAAACVSPHQALRSLRVLRCRLVFLVNGLKMLDLLRPFIHACAGSPLANILSQRPEIAGVVLWPYICSGWDAETRLLRVIEHFQVIDTLTPDFNFPISSRLDLLDLQEVDSGLRVVLDQPRWFMREGMLVINLFMDETRLYSLAFSLAWEEEGIVAYIGAIQGVDIEGVLEKYKNLTKALHGMRPRDFMVEVFRLFCRGLGVRRIYAVADEWRQHRSYYFGADITEALFMNYNQIWEERGGGKVDANFYLLSLEIPTRSLDEIPSKKRAMYRRRYELLQVLETKVNAFLEHACPAR